MFHLLFSPSVIFQAVYPLFLCVILQYRPSKWPEVLSEYTELWELFLGEIYKAVEDSLGSFFHK